MAGRKKKPASEKAKVRTFKCDDKTWAIIQANANVHAAGNVSLWIRSTALGEVTGLPPSIPPLKAG